MTTKEIRDMIGLVELGNVGVEQLTIICSALCDKVDELDRSLRRTSNEASCLANGIIPD